MIDLKTVSAAPNWRQSDVSEILERFDQAWQRGRRPNLANYVPADHAERRALIVGLVNIDLEYRLKAGDETPLVETYLRQYPAEFSESRDVIQLINAEYQGRWRREAGVRRDEYLRRFPQHADALMVRLKPRWECPLCRKTSELADETATEAACPGCLASSPVRGVFGRASASASAASRFSKDGETPNIPGYEVLTKIGSGGMGVVYKARQIRPPRVVALKMIRTGAHAGIEDRIHFQIEAEAIASMQHPNIVQIHEVGVHDGVPFFSLEFVESGSLEDRLAGGLPAPDEAARMIRTLALAMHYAHLRGIIHRDLKPGNILIAPDGTPKITDFGLAKRLDAPRDPTQTGAIMGTASYMSPEQARDSKHVGPPTDIYGLGAIFYEMLAGRPPFTGESLLETLDHLRKDEPLSPCKVLPARKIPHDLQTICLKCLKKEQAKRYATAQELADDLDRYFRHEPIHARRVSVLERTLKWMRRHPLGTAFSGFMLLMAIASLFVIDQNLSVRADERIQALITADAASVPVSIQDLAPYRHWARAKLQRLAQQSDDETKRLRASLALVEEDDSQVDYLRKSLLNCPMAEFALIRDALHVHRGKLLADLQAKLYDRVGPYRGQPKYAAEWDATRLHAAMALAAYAPNADFWSSDGALPVFLAQQLVRASPDDRFHLRVYLSPISSGLIDPLTATFHDSAARESERIVAAWLLSEYLRGNPELLAQLISEASPEQFRILHAPILEKSVDPERIAKSLFQVMQAAPPNDARAAERVSVGQRRAGAAITLLRMGERKKIVPILNDNSDPETVAQFVHRLKDRDVKPEALLDCLDRASRTSEENARFALLLALGEFKLGELPEGQRKMRTDALLESYRQDPSPGIHAVSEWLLRRWGVDAGPHLLPVDPLPLRYDAASPRQWIAPRIGGERLTFVVCPPGRFTMGSPDSETYRQPDENQHQVTLTRAFAICDREVTVGQWRQFLKETGHQPSAKEETRPATLPATQLTWYDAVAFCRWLTLKAGMDESQQCYVESDQGVTKNGKKKYGFHPERRGFRLPTEAEWEYACRAGTTTTYSFGSDQSLLKHYGVFIDDSERTPSPGGLMRPSRRGIFDMHGNVWEWCHNLKYSSQAEIKDVQDPSGGTDENQSRSYRGGSFDNSARHGRSACRIFERPTEKYAFVGLRVVCTLPNGAGK